MKYPRSKKQKRFTLFVGLALVIVSLFAPTLAARITVNSGTAIEFGQGVYEIKACQSWIQINLDGHVFPENTTNGTEAGTFLDRVAIESLNTQSCKSTTLKIKFYALANANPLPIFNGLAAGSTFVASTSIELTINTSGEVSIAPRSDAGANPITDASDSSNTFGESLEFIPATSSYIITFPAPLALMSSVTALTLESTG